MRTFLNTLAGCSAVLLCLFFTPDCPAAEEAADAAAGPAAAQKMISLNLSGPVDLPVFLDYVSKRTGKHFLYDESFSGRVTLLAPTKVPETTIFSLLEAMLEVKGYALVPAGGNLIKVVKTAVATKKPTPLYLPEDIPNLPDTDTLVSLAYHLRYVGTKEVTKILEPLGGTGKGAVVALERSSIIIITDYARNIKRLVTFIRMMDNEDTIPQVKIFTLEFASAESLAQQITRAIKAESANLGTDAKRVPAVDFDMSTNSLILVATSPEMARIEKLIEMLDVEPEAGSRNIWIYRLKNATAEKVAGTLQQLIQGRPSGVRVVPGARRPGQARSRTPVSGTLGSADVRVIGDEGQNAVIVMAPPEVQVEIAALLEELDRRKPQVLIEALVIVVSSGSDKDVGVELASWGGESEHGGIGATNFDFSTYDYATGVRTITEGLGLTGAVINNAEIPILLRSLLVENDGRVISRPRILANDNSEANFTSVDEEPYTSINTITSTTATTSYGGSEEAGTKLTITPHISEGDYLSLDIALEISQFTGKATSSEVPPAKRSDTVTTAVTVPDKSTIVIGGLSGFHSSETVSKVPILGDIPLLGLLFRRTQTTRDDTTEYIFIKAQIIRDEDFGDLKDLSQESHEKARKLEAAITGAQENADKAKE
ncbi:MAG: type II secretion system secretin GspD [Planctomycetes bacterium]|nr:type II secretion system secretin GspD [Planctomycetota bacterium]